MAQWVYKKYNKGYTSWSSEVSDTWSYNRAVSSRFCPLSGYTGPSSWDGNQYYNNSSTDSQICEAYGYYNGETSSYRTRETASYWGQNSDGYNYTVNRWTYTRTRTITKGSYIGEVVAEDGTYPANGLHTDGYWYVKDRLAFPEMWCNINGVNRKAEAGWVNINGTWRSIEEIYVKVNGVWRKSE